MNTREAKVLDLYRTHRLRDQLNWYELRCGEFGTALAQLGAISAVVLAFGASAGALAGTQVGGRAVWAVLAVVLPALSTLLSAYGALYAFEQQSKIYADAARALKRIERTPAELQTLVTTVEEVLRREQGQWGQLVAEIKPPTRAPE